MKVQLKKLYWMNFNKWILIVLSYPIYLIVSLIVNNVLYLFFGYEIQLTLFADSCIFDREYLLDHSAYWLTVLVLKFLLYGLEIILRLKYKSKRYLYHLILILVLFDILGTLSIALDSLVESNYRFIFNANLTNQNVSVLLFNNNLILGSSLVVLWILSYLINFNRSTKRFLISSMFSIIIWSILLHVICL